MKALISLIAFLGMVGAWWFWWSHFLTWVPAALLYFPMLRKLQSGSPLMVAGAIQRESLIGLSPDALAWINKHGHALIMWGAASQMSRQIRFLIALAFCGIAITAFRHSWWWLLELIPLSGVMIALHDGFRPLSQESLSMNAASGRDPFIAAEIAPLFREIVEKDRRDIAETS